MSPLGPATSLLSTGIRSPWDVAAPRETPAPRAPDGSPVAGPGFSRILSGLVAQVENHQAQSAAVTRSVLLGENPYLHQSVLAMQEASLAFSLMVEVRNKVVESYQELMRLPV